jgi:hypothetical protein
MNRTYPLPSLAQYPVDVSGSAWKGKETFILSFPLTANVAAARTTHADLFNAAGSGKVLRLVGLYILPALSAVVGVGLTWELLRTSAPGTGGSAVTPRPLDTGSDALPSQITARQKPTGGAGTLYLLQQIITSSEETSPYAGLASVLNHVGFHAFDECSQLYVCREGQGVKIDQTTSSAIGQTALTIVLTLE